VLVAVGDCVGVGVDVDVSEGPGVDVDVGVIAVDVRGGAPGVAVGSGVQIVDPTCVIVNSS